MLFTAFTAVFWEKMPGKILQQTDEVAPRDLL